MVQMMVRPSRASCFSSATHCVDVELSNPLVGSSKNMTGGLFTISSAIASRFFCPPDNRPVRVFFASYNPMARNASSTYTDIGHGTKCNIQPLLLVTITITALADS
uniref:Uncharacterized protein n=1 Tax=Anopheles albimanus TaxID=7167 RepID=A0A182F590_ANOAL